MKNSPLMEVIRKRRSVRRFLPDPVEEWKIIEMAEAARLAPSACNVQPWRIIAVTDTTLLHELALKAIGGLVPNTFAREAPLILALCTDIHMLTSAMGALFKKISYHQLDLGIAGEHLVLRATELDIGTCWIGWFNVKEARRILRIPPHVKVLSLIAAGYYREEELPGRAGKKELDQILYFEKYGNTKKSIALR